VLLLLQRGNVTFAEAGLIALSDNDASRLPVLGTPLPPSSPFASLCSTVDIAFPTESTYYVTVTGKAVTDEGTFGLSWEVFTGVVPSPFATGTLSAATTPSPVKAIDVTSGAEGSGGASIAFVAIAAGMALGGGARGV